MFSVLTLPLPGVYVAEFDLQLGPLNAATD
jgi:hypothetical protein